MVIPVLINPQSASGLLESSRKRKDEQPIAGVGPMNFRSQFGSDQRCPAAAADACRNGDVLFALRQISRIPSPRNSGDGTGRRRARPIRNIHGLLIDREGKPIADMTVSFDRIGLSQHFERGITSEQCIVVLTGLRTPRSATDRVLIEDSRRESSNDSVFIEDSPDDSSTIPSSLRTRGASPH